MGVTLKELLANCSPDTLRESAATLAELTGQTVAPAEYRAARAAITPTEHEEQVALFQWAEAHEGEHEELKLLFAVPNGGYRPMTTAAQLKAEGVRSGVPDCCLPVARGRFHSLWIEMKRKPNTTSDAQRAWLDALRRYGHCAVVCWSANEAINSIISYLEQE